MRSLQLSRKLDKDIVVCHLGDQGFVKVEDFIDVFQRLDRSANTSQGLIDGLGLQVFVGNYIDIEPVAPGLRELGRNWLYVLVDVEKNTLHSVRVVLFQLDGREISFLYWHI
jgi:hypothetical protein